MNMNYHVEHHMYPMVPFHALPRLHEEVKDQCAPAYPSLWAAWREIIPAVLKQRKDPHYFVERPVPDTTPDEAGSPRGEMKAPASAAT